MLRRDSCCFAAAVATAPPTFLLFASAFSSCSRRYGMSFDAKANGVRGFWTRLSLIWWDRVHSRSCAMMRSTSSLTLRLALMRTTSGSWMLGLLMVAWATRRLVSRTSKRRSLALPTIARRIFCDTVMFARRACRVRNLSSTTSSPVSSSSNPVRVLLVGVDQRPLRGDRGLLEQHVVGRGLGRGLGDELHGYRCGGLLERGDPLELDAVPDRELEHAVGRRHPRRLVHVELLDDLRVREELLFVGRHELGHRLVRRCRHGHHRVERNRRVREHLLHHGRVARVKRRDRGEHPGRHVAAQGPVQEGHRQLVERRPARPRRGQRRPIRRAGREPSARA